MPPANERLCYIVVHLSLTGCIHKMIPEEYTFEYVIFKMVAILFQPECVKWTLTGPQWAVWDGLLKIILLNKTFLISMVTINMHHIMVMSYHKPHKHYVVIKWKHFPHYCTFVQGIHWSLVDSPLKRTVTWTFDVSLLTVGTNCWTNTQLTSNSRHHDGHSTLM